MKYDGCVLCCLSLLVALFWPSLCTAYFFEGHQEGWFWYESSEAPSKPKNRPVPQAQPLF